MKEELKKTYDEGNDIFGYPQVYKGIELYPIKIRDVKYQHTFYQMFTHPKNYISNRDILRSSYLKFFIYAVIPNLEIDDATALSEFLDFISYITRVDDISIIYKQVPGEGLESILLKLKVGEKEFREDEFDDIREIILEQNGLSIEYVESYDPGLEESLRFANKNTDMSFQDEIFTFCSLMRIAIKDIEDYTILQFKNHFEKLLTLKEFDLYKPLLVSGQITLKSGDVRHYLYKSKKSGRYDSILVDVEEFKQSDLMKAIDNKL